MSKRTKSASDPVGSAIEGLPAAIETIRNAYQAHIEFANAVRLAVDLAKSADNPKMDRIALEQIAAALDVIAA